MEKLSNIFCKLMLNYSPNLASLVLLQLGISGRLQAYSELEISRAPLTSLECAALPTSYLKFISIFLVIT